MANFLDNISIYNAKAAVVIKNLSLDNRVEEAILLSGLKTTANDTTLPEEIRLNAITALINKAQLIDVALGPYFPSAIGFQPTQVYSGLHNALSGLNTGDYWHLTFAEYNKLVNLPTNLSATFGALTGLPTDNTALSLALAQKEDLISPSTSNKFFSWDKTFRDIEFAYITNTPTTLAGYGISAADSLFDNKYLTQSSVISTFVLGSNTPVANTNTLVQAIGNLQAQINALSGVGGTLQSVGIVVPSGFFINVSNSPLTGTGGSISFSLASQAANSFFAGPISSAGLPTFRTLDSSDLPVVPGLVPTQYGDANNYPIVTIDDKGRVTNVVLQPASGSGTVQSVAVAMPTEFGRTGSPITSNGTITFAWQNQTAKKVLAAPNNATGVPAFRLLLASDIPNIEISQVNQLQGFINSIQNLNNLPQAHFWIGNSVDQAEQKVISGAISIDKDGYSIANQNMIPLSGLEAINPSTILGRYDALMGDVQPIALSGDFVLSSGGVLSLQTPVAPIINFPGQLLTYNSAGTPPAQSALPPPTAGQVLLGYPGRPAPDSYGLIWQTLSGVIDSIDPITGVVTLLDDSIDYTKLKNSTGNNVFLGVIGGSGPIVELDGTQAAVIIDAFSGGAKGLVPAIASPDATKFLSGAGTWITVSGGGGTTTNALTINNSGSGASSGATFDGSSAVTISYNTIGAPSTTGTNASGTWGISITGNAATVTNGLYSTGSYSNPTWLTSIQGSIVSGNISGNAANVTGTVALANGGTNSNLTAVAGAVAWSSSSSIGFTAAGSTGQILRSGGTSSPTWTTATYPATTTADRILVSTSNNVIGEINAPTVNNTFLKWDSGVFSWAASGGDVTGPSGATANAIAVFDGITGKIIKDSGVTFPIGVSNGGIGITSGASGGILYFDSTSSIGSSLVLAANALVVGGGAGLAPSTITTGVGVVTALGISVGTSGSFVTNGGALGTPLSGNFSSGTFTWPTFNQNTTGSAASLTTARNIQTNLASASAASFNGTTDIQPGVTGTLAVGNGGTGISSATAYAVICAGATSTGAFQSVSGLGTSGQVLTSNGAGGLPTWQTVAGGASSLTTLSAATATASISNANSIITWNWSSNTTQNALVLNSTSLTTGALLSVTHTTSALTGNLTSITSTGVTTGNLLSLGISGSTATSADNLVITNTGTANTSGRGIDVSISGATNSGNTFAAVLSNTKTGTTSTNTAIQLTASGGTTNYAIDVTAGISRFAAGTGATPQLILTPSTAAGGTTFSGIVNGSIWYDTNSTGTANSSLTLYKDTGYTKVITKDRNPDFATGSASGVLVADTSGTITKSADLTALGIFSVYADAASITGTAATTMIGTSLVGSTTLPANFFGLGKTIRIYASGDITSANGDDTAITFKLGATTVGTFNIDNLHSTTANDWYLEAYIICNATGASGTVRVGATFFAEGTTPSGGHSWYLPVTTSSTINTTTSLAIDVLNDFVQTGMTMNVKFMTCYYLN